MIWLNRAIGTVLLFLVMAILLPQSTSAQTPYDTFRDRLVELYDEERAQEVEYAEAFELGQYGRQVSVERLKELFPTESGN